MSKIEYLPINVYFLNITFLITKCASSKSAIKTYFKAMVENGLKK